MLTPCLVWKRSRFKLGDWKCGKGKMRLIRQVLFINSIDLNAQLDDLCWWLYQPNQNYLIGFLMRSPSLQIHATRTCWLAHASKQALIFTSFVPSKAHANGVKISHWHFCGSRTSIWCRNIIGIAVTHSIRGTVSKRPVVYGISVRQTRQWLHWDLWCDFQRRTI